MELDGGVGTPIGHGGGLALEEHGVTWDVALGYFTGLRLFAPHIDAATLVRTLLVVHTCDAIMCRLIAHNNGYPKRLWTGLGFCFGVWAVAVLMLLPRRHDTADAAASPLPPPS